VAINVSAVQFRRGPALTALVARALQITGLSAVRLELEITETAVLHDTEEALVTLHRIKSLGVSIAMDDFARAFHHLATSGVFRSIGSKLIKPLFGA